MTTFTAYFDESGTHAGADVSVIAGFVGDARQWRNFEKRVSKLFARFRVDVFHNIDRQRDALEWRHLNHPWTTPIVATFRSSNPHAFNSPSTPRPPPCSASAFRKRYSDAPTR